MKVQSIFKEYLGSKYSQLSALMYGWYTKTVCNEEQVIMVYVRYILKVSRMFTWSSMQTKRQATFYLTIFILDALSSTWPNSIHDHFQTMNMCFTFSLFKHSPTGTYLRGKVLNRGIHGISFQKNPGPC